MKNLSSTKSKSDVGYWFDKLEKIINNKNTLSEELDLEKYDLFLKTEIQNLKDEISKVTSEFKNVTELDLGKSKQSIKLFYNEVQNFRTRLIDYIYNKNKYNLNRENLDALFKLAVIKCYVELYVREEESDFSLLSNIGNIKRNLKDDRKDMQVGIGMASPAGLFELIGCIVLSVLAMGVNVGLGVFFAILSGIIAVILASVGIKCLNKNKSYIKKTNINLKLSRKELKQIKKIEKEKTKNMSQKKKRRKV